MNMDAKSELSSPKVSVIIPLYNGSHFITEAVESVLNQTYQKLELIIVDDGSTDNSKEIVRKFITDRRVRLIEHGHNKGIPKTKNTGLTIARGKYIAFLDQDDVWARSKLELQLSRFQSENKNIGVVCTGMVFTDSDMKSKGIFGGLNDENQKELLKSLYLTPVNSSSIMMIKQKCFLRVGTFNGNLVGWDDYEMLMRIATQFQVKYVRRPLVKKRTHPGNVRRLPAVRSEAEKVFKHVLTLHPFLKKYKNLREARKFYNESIKLLEERKKALARKKLEKSIEKDPRYFRARFLYILSILPEQSSLKIKGIISTAINLTLLCFYRLRR